MDFPAVATLKTIPTSTPTSVDIIDGAPDTTSVVRVRVQGLSGSFTPQTRILAEGNTWSLTPIDCGYFDHAARASVAAGIAITADGEYSFDVSGSTLSFHFGSLSAPVGLYVKRVKGSYPVAGGGGGGGGAITSVDIGTTTDAAVTNPALPATVIALLKGNLSTLQAVPANPPPFQLELNDGTSVGDTPAHGFFVKAGGNVAIGSSASGVLPTPVGGVDTSGNVRDLPVIAMNGSPNQTTTFGVLAYAGMASMMSGFYNPVKAIGGVGNGTTGAFSGSTGLIGKNAAGTYDVLPGDLTNGLSVLAGGRTVVNAPTLAVTASAYAAGNCLGGKLTLTNAMRVSGGTGTLQTITLTDHGNQQPLLDILIFSQNPAGTYTDHLAFPTMSLADNALVLTRISIVASDWVTIGGTAYCTKQIGAVPLVAVGSQNLYAAMNVTSGTPTPAATTDMTIAFGILQD